MTYKQYKKHKAQLKEFYFLIQHQLIMVNPQSQEAKDLVKIREGIHKAFEGMQDLCLHNLIEVSSIN